jgi:hypothetical protein
MPGYLSKKLWSSRVIVVMNSLPTAERTDAIYAMLERVYKVDKTRICLIEYSNTSLVLHVYISRLQPVTPCFCVLG